MSNAGAAVHEMYLDRVSDKPGIGGISTTLACALDPIVAGAARSGADFLVAFSSGSLFVDPACGSGAGITSAFNLQIARVDENGNITAASVIGGGDEHGPITSVKMVPRSDGAWIAWTHQLGPQLHIARLDPKGQIATGPVEIPFFGDAASLSATSRGDRLALASARSAADASPRIRIEIISSAGSVETDVSIPLGPPPIGRTALLASPSGQDLLVSWTQEDPSGPQLRLARLACSLP